MAARARPAEVSLFQWLWRTYVRQALVPLLLVELVLLGAYLATHAWSQRQNTDALRQLVVAEIDRIAARQAAVIDQQLGQVAVLTETLRRQAARALATPPSRPEDPARYAVSPEGALHARANDGGAAVFYSALTPRGPAERDKLARTAALDPVLADITAASPLIVQAYLNTHDSLNRIWPWFDTARQYTPRMDIPRFNFYYEADATHNPSRGVVWTDAYVDPAGQGWMVSCIAPVYRGDFLEGVVGTDVTLERVVSTVLTTDLPWGGFGLLIAEDGTLLALPPAAEPVFGLAALDDFDYDRAIQENTFKPEAYNVFRRAQLQPLGALLGARTDGGGTVRMAEPYLVAWSTIPSTGWRLILMVPEARALAPAQALAAELSLIGWVMLGGLVGFYAVFFTVLYARARRVSREMAEPLGQIRGMAQSLADGAFAPAEPRMQVQEFRATVAELARSGERLSEATRAREQAERRLTQRNRELSAMFSLSPDGLASFDADGRVTEANPALLALTGWDRDGLAGLDRAAFWRRIGAQATAPVQPPRPGTWVRLTLLRPEPRVLECTVVRGVGQPEGAAEVAYFRDVTAAVELGRVKGQFVATAAHELRTPVAVMLGYAELLLQARPQPRDQDKMLETIRRHGRHVAGLIDEMLELATLDARAGEDFVLVDAPLEPLARELAASFRLPGDPRQASYAAEADALGAARIDPDRARRALANVLSNAFKYSPTDSAVSVHVRARRGPQRNELGVAVSDRGCGMDAETQARVFERFYRAESSGTVPGTGLGMSIVKEIMDLHGGRIEIDSTPGEGTTVTLWFHAAAEPRPRPVDAAGGGP